MSVEGEVDERTRMDIGIGLPNTLEIAGPAVADWARNAEKRGFSSLTTIDRVVYPTYDSLTSLAVAAGATERIGLFPDILLTPLYNPVWLPPAAPRPPPPAHNPGGPRQGAGEPARDVRRAAHAWARRRRAPR